MELDRQEGERYHAGFYDRQSAGSESSARQILPLVLDLLDVRSAVDVGCGVGPWLAVLQSIGIDDYLGIDGGYVDRGKLRIAPTRFQAADLTQPMRLGRKFDLVLCLEVAEHLPAAVAPTLVQSLCAFGDVVLFSAAIPLQLGIHHINLRWPDYWAELFARQSFVCVDCLRRQVWTNQKVSWWYAQNAVLYVKQSALPTYPKLAALGDLIGAAPLPLVHPTNYEWVGADLTRLRELTDSPSVWHAAAAFAKSIGASVRRRIGHSRLAQPGDGTKFRSESVAARSTPAYKPAE
jgi:SAM-dependent methyltransferase